MNQKHTPGPWRVWHRDAQAGGPLITDRDGAVGIARAIVLMRGQNECPAEASRNADLIAAAPDLLVACERAESLLGELRRHLPGLRAVHCDNVLGTLRAAIAKAEGGAS